MSYFSEELVRQLVEKKIVAATLAERTDISPSQISKWTRGEQTTINEAQLSLIQAAISDEPADHASLVVAHLLDEKFGLNHELVEVLTRLEGEFKDRPRPRSMGERAIQFLAVERLRNPDLNEMLISQARMMGGEMKDLPTSSSPAVKAAHAILTDAASAVQRATGGKPAPAAPTTYSTRKRSSRSKRRGADGKTSS